MKCRSVRSANVKGKRVLVTAELNVARDRAGRVVDDSRIRAVIPTLKLLQKRRAKIVLATHLGRPGGRVVSALRTKVLAPLLRRALGRQVTALSDCIGPPVEAAVKKMNAGEIVLLENTRFYPGEERNSPSFAKALSRLADVFVLESFGSAHRRHASIVGVGKYLPSYAGLQLCAEVSTLSKVLGQPQRPLVALLGGAKISTKLGIISSLLRRVDNLLLGGALANTILQAQGLQIGRSLSEPAMVRKVKALHLTDPKLHIPVDLVVARPTGRPVIRAAGAVRPGEVISDIGPDTIKLFQNILTTARTVVWNGPMGKYERRPYDGGTKAMGRAVASSRAFSVVGGGETVDALRSQRLLNQVDFISTGGGAMIEFLEGRKLPGVELVRQ
ncbi:MAG: phosphoglycerate kinase [Candidatus Kerfeldbacteria bacterium]|nr:phosphoglycerate kinase [Candidatus Kerfeldbacteria bacterium]